MRGCMGVMVVRPCYSVAMADNVDKAVTNVIDANKAKEDQKSCCSVA